MNSSAWHIRLAALVAFGMAACSGGDSTVNDESPSAPVVRPNPPSNLAAALTPSLSSVILSWTDNSTNETGFFVEVLDGESWVARPSLPANTEMDVLHDLAPVTEYLFRVRAIGAGFGVSNPSNGVTAATGGDFALEFEGGSVDQAPAPELSGLTYSLNESAGMIRVREETVGSTTNRFVALEQQAGLLGGVHFGIRQKAYPRGSGTYVLSWRARYPGNDFAGGVSVRDSQGWLVASVYLNALGLYCNGQVVSTPGSGWHTYAAKINLDQRTVTCFLDGAGLQGPAEFFQENAAPEILDISASLGGTLEQVFWVDDVALTAGETIPGREPVGSVEVGPGSSVFVRIGSWAPLTATVRSVSGAELLDRTVAWSVSDTTIATVSQLGCVAHNQLGPVGVTATSEGVYGEATVTATRSAMGLWSPSEEELTRFADGAATNQPDTLISLLTFEASGAVPALSGEATWVIRDTLGAVSAMSGALSGVRDGDMVTWEASLGTGATVTFAGLLSQDALGLSGVLDGRGLSGAAIAFVRGGPVPTLGCP